jgi:hypothetical protein
MTVISIQSFYTSTHIKRPTIIEDPSEKFVYNNIIEDPGSFIARGGLLLNRIINGFAENVPNLQTPY